MASLRSLIQDGRRLNVKRPEHQAGVERMFEIAQQCLRSHDTILANATSVAADLDVFKWADINDPGRIPCPKPPFRLMWLEVQCDVRFGFLVSREENTNTDHLKLAIGNDPFTQLSPDELDAKTIVQVLIWEDSHSRAALLGRYVYWLNAEGDYQGGMPWSLLDQKQFGSEVHMMTLWVLHTCARLNCHNVKLTPMAAGTPKVKARGKKHPPFSIWHEITVSSLPELRREQKGEVLPDGEKRDLRFHKVRGPLRRLHQGQWAVREVKGPHLDRGTRSGQPGAGHHQEQIQGGLMAMASPGQHPKLAASCV